MLIFNREFRKLIYNISRLKLKLNLEIIRVFCIFAFLISRLNKMIDRFIEKELTDLLKQFPAVTILGARQAGKTTLARKV